MTVNLQPISCGVCHGSWNHSDLQPTDILDAAKLFGQGMSPGVICKQCEMFICSSCFSNYSRRCAFGDDHQCHEMWVRELTAVEKKMIRAFKNHALVHAGTGTMSLLAAAILVPRFNPSISVQEGMAVCVFALAAICILLRLMYWLSPSDKKTAIVLGGLFGAAWGIATGAMLGWGGVITGGALGLGMFPWAVAVGISTAAFIAWSFSMPARALAQ